MCQAPNEASWDGPALSDDGTHWVKVKEGVRMTLAFWAEPE